MDRKDSAPDYFQLQHVMDNFLRAHGLETSLYKEWVLVDGNLPGIRACLHDSGRQDTTRLDIELRVSAERTLIECFAGMGKDKREATNDAIDNFCNSSLHVFLAAFWNCLDPDQVTVEKWQINGATWNAYIGDYVRRTTGGEEIPIPDDASLLTEGMIKSLPLEGDLHWVRTFYCSIGDRQKVSEVLLDNEVWTELQDAFLNLEWPPTNKYYSARNFLILKKS
ncbi:MAG TPA: DUF6348 family protein [Candidatus Angelobacter sp.]|nr:DUF6348 family protein [Candidatus Angelobacter sp.]